MVKINGTNYNTGTYEEFIKWLDDGNYPSDDNCDDCEEDCGTCKYNLVGLDERDNWSEGNKSTQEEFVFRSREFVKFKMAAGTLDPWDALNGYISTVVLLNSK